MWHVDMARGYDVACHGSTPLMELAWVMQLNSNLKLRYQCEIFYKSVTQIGVAK